jgi:K+-sensing histidine kinase KdpD
MVMSKKPTKKTNSAIPETSHKGKEQQKKKPKSVKQVFMEMDNKTRFTYILGAATFVWSYYMVLEKGSMDDYFLLVFITAVLIGSFAMRMKGKK